MPVAGRIAAKGGAAGDVDDPSATATVEEMRDREPAEVGGGLEVDGQRPRPGGVPLVVGRVVRDRFIDAGIVDEHVDVAAKLVDRRVPDVARRRRVRKIAGDEQRAALARMADNPVARLLEGVERGRANAPAGAGDEDVHGPRLAAFA